MTGPDLRKRLKEFGLTQRRFAELMGHDPTTIWKWCEDEGPIPVYAESYLHLLGVCMKALGGIEEALKA